MWVEGLAEAMVVRSVRSKVSPSASTTEGLLAQEVGGRWVFGSDEATAVVLVRSTVAQTASMMESSSDSEADATMV